MQLARLLKSLFAVLAIFGAQLCSSHFALADENKVAVANQNIDDHFDEIYDGEGNVRPEYEVAEQVWSFLSEDEKNQFLVDSKVAFSGDNALDPMPRVLRAQEYDDVIVKGVKQRARALQEFLRDYYSGENHFLTKNVIPLHVLKRIVFRHHEEGFLGKIEPTKISFVYGPDIIRDSKGNFRVIEDNPGFIGGLGDLQLAKEYLMFRFPMLQGGNVEYRDPSRFYEKLADRYKQKAAEHGGVAVAYMLPPYADNEDDRLKLHFKSNGIEVVTQRTVKQLQVDETGVYIFNSKNPNERQKVGFVFLNGDPYYMDPSYPENGNKLLVTLARTLVEMFESAPKKINKLKSEIQKGKLANKELINKLKNELPYTPQNGKLLLNELNQILSWIKESKSNVEAIKFAIKSTTLNYDQIKKTIVKLGFGHWISNSKRSTKMASGLTESFLRGQVSLSTSMGVDFIGDKEFYMYVENMIRFYLNEEPIIKNIQTASFASRDKNGIIHLNRAKLEKVLSEPAGYVIKKVDGRGGSAVWVGPKIKSQQIKEIRKAVESNPELYIVQRYTAPSKLQQNIVDIRVITDVGSEGIFVSETPWGRGLPGDGDGKVNISGNGRETAVLVENRINIESAKSLNKCVSLFGGYGK